MVKPLNRRKFIIRIGLGAPSLAFIPAALTGCGPTNGRQSQNFLANDDRTVDMQNIRMEGWSTLGSGRLGENGVLEATHIKNNVEITLDYVQDNHGHRFLLTPEHFQALREGESVSVLTTMALDHRHEVRIDPRRVDPNSTPITMPVTIDQDGSVEPLEVFVGLSHESDPKLHVSSPGEDVQYCLAPTTDGCEPNSTNWSNLEFYADRGERKLSKSLANLPFNQTIDEQVLVVRAKDQPSRLKMFFLQKKQD